MSTLDKQAWTTWKASPRKRSLFANAQKAQKSEVQETDVVTKRMPPMEPLLACSDRKARRDKLNQLIDDTAHALSQRLGKLVDVKKKDNDTVDPGANDVPQEHKVHSTSRSEALLRVAANSTSFPGARENEFDDQGMSPAEGTAEGRASEGQRAGITQGRSRPSSCPGKRKADPGRTGEYRDEETGLVNGQDAWVRKLVAYVNADPLPVALGEPDHVAADGWYERVAFPREDPTSRRDITVIEHWLSDMLSQIATDVPPEPESFLSEATGEGVDRLKRLTEEALWVFRLAFEELESQISRQSHERGEVLARVWDHFFKIIELRSVLQREETMRGVLDALKGWQSAYQQQQEAIETNEVRLHKMEETRKIEIEQLEEERSNLSAKLEEMETLLNEERERSKNLNNRLNEEVSSRLLVDERYDEKAAELRRHKEALKEAQERLDYAQNRLSEKMSTLDEKENELSERDNLINKLRKQLSEYEERRKSLVAETKSLKNELSIEQSNSESQKSEIQNLQRTLNDVRQQLNEEERKSSEMSAKLQNETNSVKELNEELKSLEKSKDVLESERKELVSNLESVRQHRDDLDGKLNRERQDKEEKVTSLEKERDALKDSLEQEKSRVAEIKAYVTGLEAEREKFRTNSNALENELSRLKTELLLHVEEQGSPEDVDALKAVKDLAAHYKDASESVKKKEDEVDVWKRQLRDEQQRRRNSDERLYEEWVKRERLERDRQKSAAKAEALSNEVEHLKTQRTEKDEEIRKLRVELANMSAHRDSLQEYVSKLEGKVSQLQAAQSELNRLKKQACNKCKQKDGELTRLRDELANEHEKANQLHEEEAYVRQDNERLSSKVEEVEAYAQDLRESLDNKALAEERLSGELQIAKENIAGKDRALAVRSEIIRGLEMNQPGGEPSEANLASGGESLSVQEAAPEQPRAPALLRAAVGVLSWRCKWLADKLPQGSSAALPGEEKEEEARVGREGWFEGGREGSVVSQGEENTTADPKEMVFEGEKKESVVSQGEENTIIDPKEMDVSLGRIQAEEEVFEQQLNEALNKLEGSTAMVRREVDEARQRIEQGTFAQRAPTQDAANQAGDAQLQGWLASLSNESELAEECKKGEVERAVVEAMNIGMRRRTHGTVFDDLLSAAEAQVGGDGARHRLAKWLAGIKSHYRASRRLELMAQFVQLGDISLTNSDYVFLLECLLCLKRLCGVDWRQVQAEWTQGQADLPCRAAADLLANVCNASSLSSTPFDSFVAQKATQSRLGPAVDLDTFLEDLMEERKRSGLPVSPVAAPRRISPPNPLSSGLPGRSSGSHRPSNPRLSTAQA